MTEDRILALVIEVANNHGCNDGFAEDIAEAIIEDNGTDLTDADVQELAEQYFEDEEEE